MSGLPSFLLIIIGVAIATIIVLGKIVQTFYRKVDVEINKKLKEVEKNANLLTALKESQDTLSKVQKELLETKSKEVKETTDLKNATAKEKAESVGFKKQ